MITNLMLFVLYVLFNNNVSQITPSTDTANTSDVTTMTQKSDWGGTTNTGQGGN